MLMNRQEFLEQTKYSVKVQKKKLGLISNYLERNPNDSDAMRKKQNLLDSIERGEQSLFDLEQLEKVIPIREGDMVWA